MPESVTQLQVRIDEEWRKVSLVEPVSFVELDKKLRKLTHNDPFLIHVGDW